MTDDSYINIRVNTPLNLINWINSYPGYDLKISTRLQEVLTRILNTEGYKGFTGELRLDETTRLFTIYGSDLLQYKQDDVSLVLGLGELYDAIIKISLSKEIDSDAWRLIKIIDMNKVYTDIELYF